MKSLFFAALLGLSLAGWGLGPCSAVGDLHPNLNVTKLRGLWFDYAFEPGTHTVSAEEAISHIYMSETNATSGHSELGIMSSIKDPVGNKTFTAKAEFSCAGEDVNSCSLKKQGHWLAHDFMVLDTDHFGYAIVQECKNYWLANQSRVLVLTRDKKPCRYIRHRIA